MVLWGVEVGGAMRIGAVRRWLWRSLGASAFGDGDYKVNSG